jgi:hypothetical protein
MAHWAEASLARTLILSGAAILVEPSERLHPELFAWARPTLLSGCAEELGALAEACDRLSSGLFRRRWLRHRVERLRLMLVEVEDAPAAVPAPAALPPVDGVAARWRALTPRFAASVRALFAGSLV